MNKKGVLPWAMGGLFLALAFSLAVFLVKPIGVSTQFVIASAIIWDRIDPNLITETESEQGGYKSPNAYLDKSNGKYAASAANPLNYSFVFVLAMVAGAFLSALTGGDKPRNGGSRMPTVWQNRFGSRPGKRYAVCFISGFIILYGARLAGGCTSGHMMSGMMQTALSGYLFAIGAFATAIPLAIMLFNQKDGGEE